MEELMLKIDNVSKEYKLGQIGGTTLRDELQRVWAKIRKKEDPTKKIGAKDYNKGEKFMALDGVSFDVKKGERVGIIGHNGAGKSTLLKLISRVTAPTGGTISMNGRVASMLEVGTGFHPELTGRENIYMNGAILGMTKKEIDAKMEDIIEFSEVRQFIDTPVKRYSSGMYVKLAFSVAAHLDSEIMIMDEVLAVGDMAFQQKCLNKMKDVSNEQGRTILYVSHNMNTIRQLCDRVVVLERGKVSFNGDVESGISRYINNNMDGVFKYMDVKDFERPQSIKNDIRLTSIELLETENCSYERGEEIKIKLRWVAKEALTDILVKLTIRNIDNLIIASAFSNKITSCEKDFNYETVLSIKTDLLVKSRYSLSISFCQVDNSNICIYHDIVSKSIPFEITEYNLMNDYVLTWNIPNWGSIHYPNMSIISNDISRNIK